jgi:exodeoxyribonuclease V alpha subunit
MGNAGPPAPAAVPLQTLEGTLERITFQNEETGYTVARLVPKGQSYEVTVIGPLLGIQVGVSVRITGLWITHPKYGRQFEARTYAVQLPATVEGLRKYLGSGLIKGVGPVNAKRIVDYFGLKTLEVIESQVERVMEVPGIGTKRAACIARAWEEQKQIKEIMLFLQSHGVSTGLAVKIYKQYGDAAIEVVKADPYRLAKDIYGVGFKTADKIAQQMGIAFDAPERIRAGLQYALGQASDDGHCFATRPQLLGSASELLGVPQEACTAQIDALVQTQELIAELPLDAAPAGPQEEALYLPPFYYAEQGVAGKLRQVRASSQDRLAVFRNLDWEKAFAWLEGRALSNWQRSSATPSGWR